MRWFSRSPLDKNMTVIIRGVGERTEVICQSLLAASIRPRNIHLIHVAPFSAALRRSLEIGLEAGRKWTVVIDADVLARPGILQELYDRAEADPQSVFAVQSEMLDKFFGGIRVGGIKVYRTALLPKALEIVPEVDVRPEAYTIKRMHKQGHYDDITNLVCGLHDFEQDYADIFRKGFVHGVKHEELAALLLPYWRRQAKIDQDFAVLLAGYEVAKDKSSPLTLNKDEVRAEFEKYLRDSGLTEKPRLDADNLTPRDVQKMLDDFKSPPEYQKVKVVIDKRGRYEVPVDAK